MATKVVIYPQAPNKVTVAAASVIRRFRQMDDVGNITDGILMWSTDQDKVISANVIHGGSY
jgi:hypothetical protein